jgi:opacity protein-like surface antigen
MKPLISILLGSLLALSVASAAQAADKKPAKAEAAAAAPAGKEVSLTGTFGCAKCSFKEADKCQNVFKVKHGAKVTSYELADNAVAKEHHDDICHAPGGKPATVKGTVSEDGGKKVITVSEIKLK